MPPNQLGNLELAALPAEFDQRLVYPVGEVRACRHVWQLRPGGSGKLAWW